MGFEPEDLSPDERRWLLEGLGLGFTEIGFALPEIDLSLLPETHKGAPEAPPPNGSARCAHE